LSKYRPGLSYKGFFGVVRSPSTPRNRSDFVIEKIYDPLSVGKVFVP
jgi:hypothetical protein